MAGFFSVNCKERSGGLALLWKEGVYVTIRSLSVGHIDAYIEGVEHVGFQFIGVYGNSETNLWKHSWNLLRWLAGDVSGPWWWVEILMRLW